MSLPNDVPRRAEACKDTANSIRLGEIAYARSGDKGNSANVGIIARSPDAYQLLRTHLTAAMIKKFFEPLNLTSVDRYELPNLGALNFVLHGSLGGGGSRSLRVDSQGKALGQAVLEMQIQLPPTR